MALNIDPAKMQESIKAAQAKNNASLAAQAAAPAVQPVKPAATAGKAPLAPVANATNTAAGAPSTGYGGASYGTSGAANTSILANQNKIASDKDFVSSEIARTQSVIKEREAQGLDTSAQKKYLSQNLGYNPAAPTGQQPPAGINDIQYNPNNIFTPGSNGGYDPAAQEKAYLQMQIDALTGQSNSNKLSTQYGIDQNKQYLQEQLDSLSKQNAVQTDATQQFNNRLGGLYSGGQQYQQGQQAAAYANQQGAVSRDVGARNQQLIDQYGAKSEAIASQIQQLQMGSPDIIRERLQSWINNERNYGLDYANTFGNLNGQKTAAQSQQDIENNANYSGTFNGNKTVGQQQQEWNNRFDYGNAIGRFSNGQQTVGYQQLQEGIRQDNRNYDRDVLESDRNYDRDVLESDRSYKYQVGRDKVGDSQWNQEFQNRIKQDGVQNAIAWANHSLSASNSAADNSLGWANLNQRKDEFSWSKDPNNPDNKPKAESYDYKGDPDFASDAAAMVKSPIEARQALRDNAQDYIDKYGVEGYNYLITTVNK